MGADIAAPGGPSAQRKCLDGSQWQSAAAESLEGLGAQRPGPVWPQHVSPPSLQMPHFNARIAASPIPGAQQR